MDSAVGLVETYLRVNGYFTVSEYPVVEAAGGDYRTATDLDLLAFRFPGAGRRIPGEGSEVEAGRAPFAADPVLCTPPDVPDMLVAEVKEGRAEFNRSGRRPQVLETALARFGCCAPNGARPLVRELLRQGRARTPRGHAVRLVAFGASVGSSDSQPYLRISLAHVLRFLEGWVDDHWEVLRHTQSKDPVLGFLFTLRKARGAPAGGPAKPGEAAG